MATPRMVFGPMLLLNNGVMKMAPVYLPAWEGLDAVAVRNEIPAQPATVRRSKALILLTTMLMTSVALIAIAIFFWQNRALKGGNWSAASYAGLALPAQSHVVLFDASQTLRLGDNVVVRQGKVTGIWRVVGNPNDSVTFKRAGATEALFMVGDASYLLTSGNTTRITPAADILAVIRPTSK